MAILNPKLMAYLPLALLLVALAVGLTMAYRLWQEMNEEDDPVTEKDVLAELEGAYYAGEMNEEEFRRVRERLGRSQGGSGGRTVTEQPVIERGSPRPSEVEPPAPSGQEGPPDDPAPSD